MEIPSGPAAAAAAVAEETDRQTLKVTDKRRVMDMM